MAGAGRCAFDDVAVDGGLILLTIFQKDVKAAFQSHPSLVQLLFDEMSINCNFGESIYYLVEEI